MLGKLCTHCCLCWSCEKLIRAVVAVVGFEQPKAFGKASGSAGYVATKEGHGWRGRGFIALCESGEEGPEGANSRSQIEPEVEAIRDEQRLGFLIRGDALRRGGYRSMYAQTGHCLFPCCADVIQGRRCRRYSCSVSHSHGIGVFIRV